MDTLKKQLAPIRGNITKIHNWLLNNKGKLNDIYQFEIKEQHLLKSYDKYEALLETIEEHGDDDLKGNCDIMEDKYCSTLSGIRYEIDNLRGVVLAPPPTAQIAPSTKLPEISINPFSGNFTEWNTFYELFENLIMKNVSLTDIQKFIYLKSYLKGEPLGLIDSLPLTNDNLTIAIDTLKDRYSNEFRIIFCHIRKLVDVPTLMKSTAPEIRRFVTQARQGVQSLTNLKVPKEEWVDLMLIFIYLQKLDFNTNKAFESERDPKKRPTLQDFFDFLDKRCAIMETVTANNFKPPSTTSGARGSHHSYQDNHSYNDNKPRDIASDIRCSSCNQKSHRISQCEKFRKLSVPQRFSLSKDKKLCRNCLSPNHQFDNCPSPRSCLICGRKHHTLLHNSNIQFRQENNLTNRQYQSQSYEPHSSPQSASQGNQRHDRPSSQNTQAHSRDSGSASCSAVSNTVSETLLATAQVVIYSGSGEEIIARALLDNGSQTSFITERLTQKLQCKAYNKNMQITSISQRVTHTHKMTDIKLYSLINNKKEFTVSCIILDKITCSLPTVKINADFLKIPKEITLADPKFFESQPIDLLLGMDIYSELMCAGFKKLGKGLPVLINTYLGWTIAGNVPAQKRTVHFINNSEMDCNLENNSGPATHTFCSQVSAEERTDDLIQRFWHVEDISTSVAHSVDDELAEQNFIKSTTRLADGTFQVDLPLKTPEEHLKLGESCFQALKRFFSLENKLKKNENLYVTYGKFIDEYVALGHAKKVPFATKNEKSELKYFLPHHCVVRQV